MTRPPPPACIVIGPPACVAPAGPHRQREHRQRLGSQLHPAADRGRQPAGPAGQPHLHLCRCGGGGAVAHSGGTLGCPPRLVCARWHGASSGATPAAVPRPASQLLPPRAPPWPHVPPFASPVRPQPHPHHPQTKHTPAAPGLPAPADLGLDVVKADIGGKGKAVHDQFWVVGADGKKLAADELPAVQQVGRGPGAGGGLCGWVITVWAGGQRGLCAGGARESRGGACRGRVW